MKTCNTQMERDRRENKHLCEVCGKPVRASKKEYWKNVVTKERQAFYPMMHKKCAKEVSCIECHIVPSVWKVQRKRKAAGRGEGRDE